MGFFLSDGSRLKSKNKFTNTLYFGQKHPNELEILQFYATRYNGNLIPNVLRNNMYGNYIVDYLYINLNNNLHLKQEIDKLKIPPLKSKTKFQVKIEHFDNYQFGAFMLGMIIGDGNVNAHRIIIYQKYKEHFDTISERLTQLNIKHYIRPDKRSYMLVLNKESIFCLVNYMPLNIFNHKKISAIKKIISTPYKNTKAKKQLFTNKDILTMKKLKEEGKSYTYISGVYNISRGTVKRWISNI